MSLLLLEYSEHHDQPMFWADASRRRPWRGRWVEAGAHGVRRTSWAGMTEDIWNMKAVVISIRMNEAP